MSENALRMLSFLSLLVLMGLAEWRWPRQHDTARRGKRWPVNLGLGAINVLALRVLMPWLAIDAALWAETHHVGLLAWLQVPALPAAIIAFVALDLVIYGQHRLMHVVDVLWRLHRVHHTDLALDVTSGVRFHPLEILLSMLVKIAAVILIGASPVVVVVFEIVLSSFSLMTHTNLRLPVWMDAALRWVFVTPDMHRIHHSVLREEHDSNYGFHVSWWDRLFGSYRIAPRQPQETMPIGLDVFRDTKAQRLQDLLIQPAKPAR
ncbi:MAG: sterol desaturase family protein [Rhodanobacter sp.]|nr:MAG: sterol desaturase family protein [Rhodanobacter sp.]